jgi:hypothetical protein
VVHQTGIAIPANLFPPERCKTLPPRRRDLAALKRELRVGRGVGSDLRLGTLATVVARYNQIRELNSCSLRWRRDLAFDVILADDGSAPPAWELAERAPSPLFAIRQVCNPTRDSARRASRTSRR